MMRLKRAAKQILEIPNVVSVAISKNHDAKNHEIFGDTYEILAGKETITETMGDITYALNPKAFYQINPEEAEKMYNYIKTLLDEKTDKHLVDLYTGSGAMALYFAQHSDQVIGIDNSEDSIKSAHENKKLNHIKNVRFIQGDAAETMRKLHDEKTPIDVCIFDPPRTGLDDSLIDLLNRKPINKLIYVSCNPSTLTKNLKKLSRRYTVLSVMPFDMFPQTSHVESITLLSLK